MQNIKKVIAILAGKGGVGKSTLSVFLAHALSQEGLRVGILDADIYGPSIAKMMGATLPKSHMEEGFLPAQSHEIVIMSMAFFNKGSTSFVRAPVANQMVLQFIHSVEWGELDLLIIDCPPGTGDIHLTLMQEIAIDGALVIMTPQKVCEMDAKKAAEMARLMHVPLLGVVENMASFYDPLSLRPLPLFAGSGAKDLADFFNIPLRASLAFDSRVAAALDRGENPLIDENSPLTQSVRSLARGLLSDLFGEIDLTPFELVWDPLMEERVEGDTQSFLDAPKSY